MTPNIAVVRIQTHGPRSIPLWIPLFLLWIPAILLSPLIFAIVYGLCVAGKISPWRAIAALWAILCSLPGTHVQVSAVGTRVLVRIL